MSINSYEVGADGSRYDEIAFNQFGDALGKIDADSLNPMKGYDYIIWRDGAVYYAQNGRTGVVTSNAACHSLVNGVLGSHTSIKFVPSAVYYELTGAINFSNYTSAHLVGSPKRGVTLEPADTVNAIEFDENWWCVVEGFEIDGSNQTTSGMGLMFTEATGTNYAKKNQIKNIEFSDCYTGIGDLYAGTNGGSNNLFRDLTFINSTYSDIKLNVNGTGGWSFQNIGIDHLATQCTDDYSFRMIDADGLLMDKVSLLMGGAGSKGGALIQGTNFIWMTDCDIEKAGLTGWNFTNCHYGQIKGLRMHESGMRVAAAGEASIRMIGVRDFTFMNSSLNISAGATNSILNFQQDGATQCDHITFIGGHVTNSSQYGAVISNTSGNLKFIGLNFYGNADEDVHEEDSPNFNTYKGNTLSSGNGLTFLGARNTYDQFILSDELDLTGGATDVATFFAPTDCILAGYRIFYTVATGGGAGVAIRVGHYADGVALDNDYYDISTSEVNEAIGHEGFFTTAGLTLQVIPAGHVVTVGTAGGKADTGKVKLVLSIIENAS